MDGALRAAARKSFAVTLVVASVGVGYVLHGSTSAHSRRAATALPTKLTAAQLMSAAATATAGLYLQFDGVTGPPGPGFVHDMPITSFSFGVSRQAGLSGGNRVVGQPNISDVNVTHTNDKYSVAMLNQAIRGTGTGNAVIYLSHVITGGRVVDLLEFDLGQVVVTSDQMSGAGDTPTESFSLNFTSITMIAHYGGTQSVSYNLITQT